jgi:Tol biopolymer transport system component
MRGGRTLSVLLAVTGLGVGPAPELETRTRFEVVLTEGTNMAAALSPDGRTLAIDLVGRIWTVPAEGGSAFPLTDPFGDARAPTWSPDGRRIAFQGYWKGDYDIWVVGTDGAGLAQITSGPFDDREPHWSPDGSRVAFASDRGGSYDVWEVDVEGGAVRRLTDAAGNEYNPAYAPDGRRVAYVTDGPEAAVWVRGAEGASTRLFDLAGGQGFTPSWSPDGAHLAFNRLSGGASELHVAQAIDGVGLGIRVSAEDEDVFPFRASWRADGSLLYTADGAVRTRPVEGGRATDVPFQATVTLDRPAYRKRLRSFEPAGPRPVLGIVAPALSPDASSVVFTALGDLWVMEIGGAPAQLTDDPWVEVDAAWSPDGTRVAYASDRTDGRFDLWVRDLFDGTERRLTTDGGRGPAWSPDGTEIAYSGGFGPEGGLRVLDVASGQARTVRSGLNEPGRPTWAPDGRSIVVSALQTYSSRFREGVNRPLSIPVQRPISEDDGAPAADSAAIDDAGARSADASGWGAYAHAGDVGPIRESLPQVGERWLDFVPHVSVGSRGRDGPVWSRDGRTMAYVSGGVLWAVDVAPDGTPLGPPSRLNNELTADPTWAADSRTILYQSGPKLRRLDAESGRIVDVALKLEYVTTVPEGRFVVHAGQLFDGVSDGLRRDVDVVVDGHRIARVTPHDPALHAGNVVDASDGVLMPGLIEMHAHGGLSMGEIGGRHWLAYGVTSVRNPAADPHQTAEERESWASGRRLGPRPFGTGYTIDGSRIYYAGAPALSSTGLIELGLEEAEAMQLDLIKTYVRLSDPMQRRVIEDAHALGLPVTSHELYPGVAYGADGVEHVRGTSRRGYSTKVTQLNRSYGDVVELLARSGMTLTPTVGIYGGHQLVAEEDPTLYQDRRVQVFFPQRAEPGGGRGGSLAVRRRMVSDMASLARRVLEEGGVVVLGTDSPINPPGIALLAEMQALVEYGGMRPVDVLRAATSVSADAMGYGAELGAIRPGMLADMIVLGADPLVDIRALRDVRTVVADGRVLTLEALLGRPGA